MSRFVLLVGLVGCAGSAGGDKPQGTTGPVDHDGDGAIQNDCDDQNAAVHPGAPEHCDGVDEDCDGAPDDDPVDGTPKYLDDDGDGYGDAASDPCDPEAPGVPDGGDCDDAFAADDDGAGPDVDLSDVWDTWSAFDGVYR